MTSTSVGKRVWLTGAVSGTYAQFALCEAAAVRALPFNVTYEQACTRGNSLLQLYRRVSALVTPFLPFHTFAYANLAHTDIAGCGCQCVLPHSISRALSGERTRILCTASLIPAPLLSCSCSSYSPQKAHAKPGQTVLVHGGSGGTGLATIQLANAGGLKVIILLQGP